jgi:hypothetical protein
MEQPEKPDLDRREFVDFGRLGIVDNIQFIRLGLGLMLTLLAVTMGALTLDTVQELSSGRNVDHVIARTAVALVAVFSAFVAARLLVLTVLEIRLSRTGKRAIATIVAVETCNNVRFTNSYRFHDDQGNPREGWFDTRVLEWKVGDEGMVYYSDGWIGSHWVTQSKRDLPQPPPPSIGKGLAKMAGFLVAASLLVASAVLLSVGGWAGNVIDEFGLYKGGALLSGLWLLIAAFAFPIVAVVALCLGPFVLAAWAIAEASFRR